MQPVAPATDEHEPGVSYHRRAVEHVIGHQPRGDAVKAAAAAARPDLGAQEAQRHLDETVIEMRDDNLELEPPGFDQLVER